MHTFEDTINIQNLLGAWEEFVKGKRKKKDVQEFALHLTDNIFNLHEELLSHTYKHDKYIAFNVSDPKPRNIHKALVKDRLLHHAIHKVLYPYFDRIFIFDSYSCRVGKGTHKAINRFRKFSYKVSKNNTRTCWILKCDIKKFFVNIDHQILFSILKKHIKDASMLWLLKEVVESFPSGLPLGNLTSQLLVNVYMNEFDQFIKHKLKAKYYIRYADDFVILSDQKYELLEMVNKIQAFLKENLALELNQNKVFIKSLFTGVDFLGWVHFPDHRILRSTTAKRMLRRIKESQTQETISSYSALVKHGNTYKLRLKTIREALKE